MSNLPDLALTQLPFPMPASPSTQNDVPATSQKRKYPEYELSLLPQYQHMATAVPKISVPDPQTPTDSVLSKDQHQLSTNLPLANVLMDHRSYSHQPMSSYTAYSQQMTQASALPNTSQSHNTPPYSVPHSERSLSQSNAKTPRPPKNKSKFKRFRNAFIFFVNDQRTMADGETKKLKNREFLRLMSSHWKDMSEEERSPYVQLAEADKKRFNEDVKKFGKYESRQRRYKSRFSNKGITSATKKHGNSAPALSADRSNGMAGPLSSSVASETACANVVGQPDQPQIVLPLADINNEINQMPAFSTLGHIDPTVMLTPPAYYPDGKSDDYFAVCASNVDNVSELSQQQATDPLSIHRTSFPISHLTPGNTAMSLLSPNCAWAHSTDAAAGPYLQQQVTPSGGYIQIPTGMPITQCLTDPILGASVQQTQITPAAALNQFQTSYTSLQEQGTEPSQLFNQ